MTGDAFPTGPTFCSHNFSPSELTANILELIRFSHPTIMTSSVTAGDEKLAEGRSKLH